MVRNTKLILLICALCLQQATFAQARFCEHFNCDNLNDVLHGFKSDFAAISGSLGVPLAEVLSLAAPETVVYSQWRDRMETTAAEFLYVRVGSMYGNFSLGYFQIKPTFVAELTLRLYRHQQLRAVGDFLATANTVEGRGKRIDTIKDIRSAFRILALFYRLTCIEFPEVLNWSNERRIKFMATRYNAGLQLSAEQLVVVQKKEQFPNDMISRQKFSYAETAYFLYVNYLRK